MFSFMSIHITPGGHSHHYSDFVMETNKWNPHIVVWLTLKSKHSSHSGLLGTPTTLAPVVFRKGSLPSAAMLTSPHTLFSLSAEVSGGEGGGTGSQMG